jgi:hypothetical protein
MSRRCCGRSLRVVEQRTKCEAGPWGSVHPRRRNARGFWTAVTAVLVAAAVIVSAPDAAAGSSPRASHAATIVAVKLTHEQWVYPPGGYVIVAAARIAGGAAGSAAIDCRAHTTPTCFALLDLPGGSLELAVTLNSGGGGHGSVLAGTGRYAGATGRFVARDVSNTSTIVRLSLWSR